MPTIRQRSMLARIEGQLARLARLKMEDGPAVHWQRIEWAGKALQPLLAAPEERARFRKLFEELRSLRSVAVGSSQFLHRSTLLRADCVIWQLSLVQGGKRC